MDGWIDRCKENKIAVRRLAVRNIKYNIKAFEKLVQIKRVHIINFLLVII